MKPYNTK